MSERAGGSELPEELARAEADVERARERVVSSVVALRDRLVRQTEGRRGAMKTAEQIEDAVSEAGARLKPKVEEARRQISSWNDTVIDYVKKNPGRCLLGALALGFVVGKIAQRA